MDLKGKKLKQLAKLNLPIHWTPELKQDSADFRTILVTDSQEYLNNYRSDEAILLFTDASKTCWSLVVMQAPCAEVLEQIDSGRFTPKLLLFLS